MQRKLPAVFQKGYHFENTVKTCGLLPEARDELLLAYDERTIDDEELVLLLKQSVSKDPSFPYKHHETLDLKIMDPMEYKLNFESRKMIFFLLPSPTMPRHIRDFYVTSARKFKLNNDLSCLDKKKNGRNLQTVCMSFAITSLLVKVRKSLHMAF